MRKKIRFILFVICALFLLLFALFGCDQNKTDNTQSPNNKSDGVLSSSFFKISGDELSGKVSNSTTKFSFSNYIDVVSTATYTISTDMNGGDIIKSKTVNLNIGDNVFYVIVENGNDAFVYTVTIRRRPIYDVNFIANGSVRYHVKVEEDGFISEPKESIAIKGYEFNGWDFDFSKPIVNDTTIYLKYDKPIIYAVQFDLNDDKLFYKAEYDNNLTECTINDIPKYPIAKGYKFVKWSSAFDDVNRTVIFKANWEIEEYKISYEFNDDYSVSQVKSKKSYPASYTVESEIDFLLPEREGYTLIAWDALPIQKGNVGDVVFTAEWDAIWYNVKYLLNDDALPQKATNSISNPERFNIDSIYYLEKPTCEGFEFCGWYCDDEMGNYIYKIDRGTHENITICGVWGTKGLSFSNKSGNETSVTGYSGESNSIILPKRYNGAIVKKIGEEALRLKRITNVTIPDSIVEIGASAFYGTSITSIFIPDSVQEIGDSAFYMCNSLESIRLPFTGNKRRSSGMWGVFGYIFGFKKTLSDPNPVEGATLQYSFRDTSFQQTERYWYYIPTSLKEVILGGGLSYHSFYGCEYLTRVVLNTSYIDADSFYGCFSLRSIVLSNSLKVIDNKAFSKCTNLKEIVFKGTIAEWNAVEKGDSWDSSLRGYVVQCDDGIIKVANPYA